MRIVGRQAAWASVAAVAAAVLLLCSPVWALTWSTPQTLAMPQTWGGTSATLQSTAGGVQVLLATTRPSGAPTLFTVADLGADGTFGTPTSVPWAPAVAGDRLPFARLDGRGNLVLAGLSSSPDGRARFRVATGGLTATRPRIDTLWRGALDKRPQISVAVGPAGDVAVLSGIPAYVGARPPTRLLVRRAGATVFRHVTTFSGGARALAVNGHGDVLVAWDSGSGDGPARGLLARVVRASGHATPVRRVGPGANGTARIAVALDDRRRAAVVWLTQHSGEMGYVTGLNDVRAATSPPGGRLRIGRVIESGMPHGYDQVVGPPAVAFAGPRVVLAWQGRQDERYVVRAARAVPGGAVGPAQVVSRPGAIAVLGDLATGAGGRMVLGLSELDAWPVGPYGSALAAVAPTGASAFAAPDLLAKAREGEAVWVTDAVIAPDGRAVLVLSGDKSELQARTAVIP